MTTVEQIQQVLCDMRGRSDDYTEEELRTLYAAAKEIASLAAEAIVAITAEAQAA